MNKKIRIAIASYTLNSTQGLSYVAQALLSRFMKRDDFECAFVSVAGENTTEQGLGVWGKDFLFILGKLTIANCQLLSKENVVNFDPFIKEWQPDILISVCDPWMQDQYSYSPYRSSYYWCLYQHIETPEYPEWVMMPTSIVPNIRKSIKNIMQSADLIIPVTEMGKNTLLKFGYKHVTTPIYNGLDIDKIITKDVLKQYAFGTTVKEEDFIFMTLGVNNERKKLDRTLEAFAKFLNKKGKYRDRYKLYLHAPLDMQQGGTDLKEAIIKLNIGSNVLTISDYQKDVGISKSSLYSKYKACDCFILLTGGEGFGYGYLEAIAHGKPVIYTDYGGHPEFCKNFGLSVPVSDYVSAVNGYIKFALADINVAANRMEQISSNKELYKKLSTGGYEFVKTNFDWNIIFQKFLDMLMLNYKNNLENSNKIDFPLKRII